MVFRIYYDIYTSSNVSVIVQSGVACLWRVELRRVHYFSLEIPVLISYFLKNLEVIQLVIVINIKFLCVPLNWQCILTKIVFVCLKLASDFKYMCLVIVMNSICWCNVVFKCKLHNKIGDDCTNGARAFQEGEQFLVRKCTDLVTQVNSKKFKWH